MKDWNVLNLAANRWGGGRWWGEGASWRSRWPPPHSYLLPVVALLPSWALFHPAPIEFRAARLCAAECGGGELGQRITRSSWSLNQSLRNRQALRTPRGWDTHGCVYDCMYACCTYVSMYVCMYSRPREGGSPRRRFALKGGLFQKVVFWKSSIWKIWYSRLGKFNFWTLKFWKFEKLEMFL